MVPRRRDSRRHRDDETTRAAASGAPSTVGTLEGPGGVLVAERLERRDGGSVLCGGASGEVAQEGGVGREQGARVCAGGAELGRRARVRGRGGAASSCSAARGRGEGRKERGREKKKRKRKKEKEKGREKEKEEKRERKERSLGGFRGGDRGRSRTRAGRAWRTERGGTGRRDSGWISGPGFREIGRSGEG